MLKKSLRLFLSAGEESADLHASALCQHLRELDPQVALYGFGGEKMREAGMEILYPLPDLALIGFVEVLKHLPTIRSVEKLAKKTLDTNRPDALILIDYPGFNFRLANEAHKRGIPVFYFIAPQVWAWKEKRVETMRRWLTHLFVIFPFEESYFQNQGLPATYVGNPLVERIPPSPEKTAPLAERLKSPLVGLLPGSRKSELHHLLPIMVQAATLLRAKRPEARFRLIVADSMSDAFLQTFPLPTWLEVVRDTNYQLRREMDFAWTASGTATVENALLGLPMAVVYRTQPINMFLGRHLVRILYIGMVNLIAQKGICPELIQEQCHPALLARFADDLFSSPDRYQEMIHDLHQVRKKIGPRSATRSTAEYILAHFHPQT